MRRLLIGIGTVLFVLAWLAPIALSSRTVRHLFRPAKTPTMVRPTETPATMTGYCPGIMLNPDVPSDIVAKTQDLFRATRLDGTVDIHIIHGGEVCVNGGNPQVSEALRFRFTIHVPNLKDQRYLASLVHTLAPIPQQATLPSTHETTFKGEVRTIFTTGDASCTWDPTERWQLFGRVCGDP